MTIGTLVLEAEAEATLPSGRRVEGFERTHWRRWGEALGASGAEQGGLLLLADGGHRSNVRAVHSSRGVIQLSEACLASPLAEVASRHGCWWAMKIGRDDLSSLSRERWALREEGDYLERLLELWSALEDLQGEGRLESWPHRLAAWPALVELAPQGLAPLCPDEQAAVAAIWRGRRLSTALAFRRRRGRIDRILGPAVLEPAMGLVSGDWTRDYRYLSQAAERLLGCPLGLGVFGQEAAVYELSHRGDPGAWVRAMVARDVIISPLSQGLALPLGIDWGRGLLRRARDYVASRGLSDWLRGDRIFTDWGGLFESEARRPDLRDLLGLDPFSMLKQALGADEQEAHSESPSPLVGAGG